MVISRVIIRITPFKALITLLITYLLSPLPLQVPQASGRRSKDCWAADRQGRGVSDVGLS